MSGNNYINQSIVIHSETVKIKESIDQIVKQSILKTVKTFEIVESVNLIVIGSNQSNQ